MLTVGASRSSRGTGGWAKKTFGEIWDKAFPDPPIATQRISGDPDALAAFSSRGPCDDRRIKPDLVAPGTNIVSARSKLGLTHKYWDVHANPKYAYWGGTSMAAPLVAGCAALVRQYYQEDRRHNPSAALLKATLINGARWLTGDDAVASPAGVPNFHQGFGCLFMPWTIPNKGNPSMRLEYLDTWKTSSLQLRTGQKLRRRITVSGGERLRFCMAYTDRPARSGQNNLNLLVEHVLTKEKWVGNADLPRTGPKTHAPDPDNNVEVVRIENPKPGDYLVKIEAIEVFRREKQAVALVITGDLTSGLENA